MNDYIDLGHSVKEISNDNKKQERINSIIENEALKVLNYYKSSLGDV